MTRIVTTSYRYARGSTSHCFATRQRDDRKPAIVTTTSNKRRIGDGPPPPMELPLSRQPVEREGDDYKRLKATMARQLRNAAPGMEGSGAEEAEKATFQP